MQLTATGPSKQIACKQQFAWIQIIIYPLGLIAIPTLALSLVPGTHYMKRVD